MVLLSKQQVACLSLLILMMIFPLKTSFLADVHGRFNRLRSGSSSSSSSTELRHVKSHGFFKGNAEKNGGDHEIFDEEKRKIHTGPNPLHNR
ncbi:hypothetical protein Nepgr_030163 [Nepenthes gracilis]|uniref:Uncharacterized protein n=1 Tax=Nepenthes gracilis TaxID=150966 RepID=A0AAD3Y5J9_NEPGR|nr:hypothetical protein Nepgr_030163 [Nepenthes gracilis]